MAGPPNVLVAELSITSDLDEEWIKYQLMKRKVKLMRRLYQRVPQESKDQESLLKVPPDVTKTYVEFQQEQTELIEVRRERLKSFLEMKQNLAQVETTSTASLVDSHISGKSVVTVCDNTSVEMEDSSVAEAEPGQALLERLQALKRRADQLQSMQGAARSGERQGQTLAPTEGFSEADDVAEESPMGLLGLVASPDELLTLLKIIQYK